MDATRQSNNLPPSFSAARLDVAEFQGSLAALTGLTPPADGFHISIISALLDYSQVLSRDFNSNPLLSKPQRQPPFIILPGLCVKSALLDTVSVRALIKPEWWSEEVRVGPRHLCHNRPL